MPRAICGGRLVHLVDPDDDMTESEIHEAMEEDFKSDSNGTGAVTKDEFMASVFELADPRVEDGRAVRSRVAAPKCLSRVP